MPVMTGDFVVVGSCKMQSVRFANDEGKVEEAWDDSNRRVFAHTAQSSNAKWTVWLGMCLRDSCIATWCEG